MKRKALLITLAIIPSLQAMADTFGAPAAQPAQEEAVVAPDFPLPTLKLVLDCGDCQMEEKIRALVEGAYLDGADKTQAKIDENLEPATYTVKSYRTRGKARYFIGALAGADYIKGTLSCEGQEIEVGDTAVSAINGIEAVAHNVGEEAFKKLVECKKTTMAATGTPAKGAQ